MDTYSFLRQLADSWGLLALAGFFVGAVLWACRPGSAGTHAEAGDIPFRNDSTPGAPMRAPDTCDGAATRNPEGRQ